MPLLRRQVLQKTSTGERLRDGDEVLYCKPTGEIFSNYEDYFHRIMLISSMVWTCAMTGRPNLTYLEALDSEKDARKLLKTFPAAVKGPFLLVASHTQRTSINEMHEDVYGFVKDHLFKGESVDAMDPVRKVFRRAAITNVLVDSTQTPNALTYQVRAADDMTPKVWTVPPGNVKRDRSTLTREKCKLFLKQHVEAGPGGQLRIKADSLARFVTGEGWTDGLVFHGQTPSFQQSKRLKQNAERGEAGGGGAAASTDSTKQPAKQKKQTKPPAADGADGTGKPKKAKTQPPADKGKERKGKELPKAAAAGSTGGGGGKQQSIAKYVEKLPGEALALEAKAKKQEEEAAQLRLRVEQEALAKRRAEEEKALLAQQVTLALKRYNAVLEDQELPDQRPLPPVRPVRPLIAARHFSSFVFILEYLNSFADLLAIRSKFPGGLTIHLLERALILREVNGPLSDIFQVLLSAIFTQQLEEENEESVRYERIEGLAQKRQTVPEQVRARDAALWCEKHYSTKLSEMPIDSMTVSELLRLHFLASGALVEERAARHRYQNRGGYGSGDDPGLRLVRDYPHILRALNWYSVYQLPVGDIIQILCCLIHQLLTYSGVRDLVEERVEKARAARTSYQANRWAQRRLTVKAGSLKNAARDDMKRELAGFEGDQVAREEHRRKLADRLEEQCARIEADAQRQLKVLQAESERLKEDFFDYQIYLGTDRCYRNYWLFESLPGLFVEHDRTYAGRCLDRPTPHIPGLAACAPDQRKKYITRAIMRCAGTDGVVALLDAKAIADANAASSSSTGPAPVEEVYEQLLTLGSAKLESAEQQQQQQQGKSRANSAEPATDGANGGVATNLPPTERPASSHELLMCTAQPDDCPVHTEQHPGTVGWGYYATADELDALIRSLNGRGVREKQLRETLECERDLIVTHIAKCPLDKLSVGEADRAGALAGIASRNQKRYDAPNFSHEPGTEPNEILEAVFLENLLELEAKITVGYLGVMRVRDRDKWREALEAHGYDAQTDRPLVWGPKRLAPKSEEGGNGREQQDGEQKQVKQENGEPNGDRVDSEQDQKPVVAKLPTGGGDLDSERDSLERLMSEASHPGQGLPDTTVSLLDETLEGEEVSYPLHESETLRQRVQSLSRALLQVAQCIDPKFLRHPFGPKKDHKDRAVMQQKQHEGLKNLVRWEVSLMQSTCYAQLFLHYNVLYDAIHWSRSAERICCMICRRKGDPGLTLLCDECNRACHTYCLKPKLKEVPAGDWYCKRCRPENFKEKPSANRKKKKKMFRWKDEDEEGEEEEEEEEEQEEDEEEQNGRGHRRDEMEEDAEEEGEEEQAEEEDGDGVERRNEADESAGSQGSGSDDGAKENDDDGSDADYRTKRSRLMVKVAKVAKRSKPKAKAKPTIVVTSTGRTSRSTAATNGAYRYGDDGEDDEEKDDDDGEENDEVEDETIPDEDDESYDEREERRKRPRAAASLSNGGADRKRNNAQRRSASKKHKRAGDAQDVSPPASKRARRSTNGRAKVAGPGTYDSDEEPLGGGGSRKAPIRTSARSTKGQRRSSPYNDYDDEELDDEENGDEEGTVARLRMGAAARRSRRTGDDLPLNSVALYTLIDDILKHPNSWPFNRPVSAKEVPDYYAVIKSPMDFARIKSKLNMGDYKINEQMLSDVQLVFRNCDLYNTDETDVYRIGRDLERYVVKRCKELNLPFQPSDMQKPGVQQNGPPSKSVNGVGDDGAHGK
ncbi:bromodomain adjacent to zinc finger domain protein 1A [Anopheles arabiensis]|uniref:Bromodomain adjacent to zinc finger domain protein 1A n=1 Tax=Anopheles arabiensis TaxID=7173 RepID=A0A182I9X8_ANOAR|nr:bromodomain adjacent to zinc finger domain protein 1A [Anopheles arabiensis]